MLQLHVTWCSGGSWVAELSQLSLSIPVIRASTLARGFELRSCESVLRLRVWKGAWWPAELVLTDLNLSWHCRDRVSSCNMYIYSNKIHSMVLMSKFYSALFVSSTRFGPHRSIIRSVLYKLYSQTLVCGNTRTHSSTTYQILQIQLVQNAPDDGPMRSETCRANLSAE